MTAQKIKPLSNSQKLFLQRLMTAHILPDQQARDLYNAIRNKFANVEVDNDEVDPAYMGNGFEHNLGLINVSLKNAFNLEICTVFLPPPYDPDAPEQSSAPVKYHAVINKSNDQHAKSYAAATSHYGPHELAYLRLLLEKLVERDNNNTNTNVKGCRGVMNRMDILNARTELEEPHANKLTIPQSEAALELFLIEKWLVEMRPSGEVTEDEDSDNLEDDGEDKPKKKKRKKSSGGDRRKSLKGTYYGIGPRCFLELGEYLQGVGFPEERMPQIILNMP